MAPLTAAQRNTIRELQAELRGLNLEADIAWAKYIHTHDEECFNEVMALEGEIEMKGLIAYMPKAGERKIKKIRNLIENVKTLGGMSIPGPKLGTYEARIESLDSINAWRDEYHLPPLERLPRGTPGDSTECTLAKAIRMTMIDMGIKYPHVAVSGANDIELADDDGNTVGGPDADGFFETVIGEFDDNAWLDLLTDFSLENYQRQCFENEDSARLLEIAEEWKIRGKEANEEEARMQASYEEEV